MGFITEAQQKVISAIETGKFREFKTDQVHKWMRRRGIPISHNIASSASFLGRIMRELTDIGYLSVISPEGSHPKRYKVMI